MLRTIETIEDLAVFDEGRVAVAFKAAMRQMVFDLADRPAVAKARSVTIQVQMAPDVDDHGDLGHVLVDVDCKKSVPSQRSRAVVAKLIEGETVLRYNDLAPDAPEQRTIDQELDRKENAK